MGIHTYKHGGLKFILERIHNILTSIHINKTHAYIHTYIGQAHELANITPAYIHINKTHAVTHTYIHTQVKLKSLHASKGLEFVHTYKTKHNTGLHSFIHTCIHTYIGQAHEFACIQRAGV